MTEEQSKKLNELIEKQYVKEIPLTHDEELLYMELKRIKQRDRDEEQERLLKSACTKIQTALGLTYDELAVFCDWLRG